MTRLQELNARFQEAARANDTNRMVELLAQILTELSQRKRYYYYTPTYGYVWYPWHVYNPYWGWRGRHRRDRRRAHRPRGGRRGGGRRGRGR